MKFLMWICKSISIRLFGKPREQLPRFALHWNSAAESTEAFWVAPPPPPKKSKSSKFKCLLMMLKNLVMYQFSLSFDLQIGPLATFHTFIPRKIKEYSRIFWVFYREYGIEYFGGFLRINFRALLIRLSSSASQL